VEDELEIAFPFDFEDESKETGNLFLLYFLVACLQKKSPEALPFFLKAASFEDKIDNKNLLETFFYQLSDYYEQQQDFFNAYQYLDKYFQLSQENMRIKTQTMVDDLQQRLDFESKEKASEIYRLRNIELKHTNMLLSVKKEDIRLINSILRHDLSNNLVAVNSSIRLMRRTNDTSYLNDSIAYLKKSVSLINNMRNLESFLLANKGLKMYDLKKVIFDVIQDYPQIEFNVTGSCKVIADEAISSVFDNLFSNALHHGNATKIEIEIVSLEPNCEIRVKDNGVCIPNEWKEKIFEEEVTYGKKAKSGMGLFIVSKTIERYGGFIFVSDNVPCGCIFTFRLKMVRK
jgi:signal transduction histidine kinase